MILKQSFSISLTDEERRELAKKCNSSLTIQESRSLADHVELMLQQAYCQGLEDAGKGLSDNREIPV